VEAVMSMSDSRETGAETPSPDPSAKVAVPPILKTKKSSPVAALTRAALVVVLLYLIFGVILPSFADYSDVWDALTSLEPTAALLLVALVLVIESCQTGAYALLTRGLGFPHAFMAQEASVVVSNTVPGPSGTAARYVTYRKFGVTAEDFGQSYVVVSIWNNGVPLLLPGIALLALSSQQDVAGAVVALAAIGLAVSVVAGALLVVVVRSERWAFRLGEWFARVLNWARGLVRRPPEEQVGETVVRFRFTTLRSVRDHWAALSALILGKELATFLTLLGSLRALGENRVALTALEVFAVYAVVRLATMVQITPGGVGIVESLYIAALLWATDGADEATVVAAVFVFRLLPILLGGVCWLLLPRALRHSAASNQTADAS
jgi:uncharacterized protein (TIRG00374 family)